MKLDLLLHYLTGFQWSFILPPLCECHFLLEISLFLAHKWVKFKSGWIWAQNQLIWDFSPKILSFRKIKSAEGCLGIFTHFCLCHLLPLGTSLSMLLSALAHFLFISLSPAISRPLSLPRFVDLKYICQQIPVSAFSTFLHLLFLSFCPNTSLSIYISLLFFKISILLSVVFLSFSPR